MTARRRWYAHVGLEEVFSGPGLAVYPGESLAAARMLAEVEYELGEVVAAHMLRPDPRWVLRWFRAEATASGRTDLGEPEPRHRSKRRSAA